jgi:type VI secretion system protein ImpM
MWHPKPPPAAPAAVDRRPGFFGKLPARGDFVGRRLEQAFRGDFDDWLQKSIATSRRQLGAAWLAAYLDMPIWRFVLGANLCGEVPSLGVMMPSVDKVGRYFPLVLGAQLPGCVSPGTVFQTARSWFDAAEQLILTALDDAFDFEAFDAAVLGLGVPAYARAGLVEDPGRAARHLDLPDLRGAADMAPTYARILGQVRMGDDLSFSLWWTQGSERVRPSVLLCPGLPAPPSFAAFLDGAWDEWGWEPLGGDDASGVATMNDMPVLTLKPKAAHP